MAAATAQSERPPLEIKKYANRRYYDAANSRHLTLNDIRSLVQRGYDLRIIDATSSHDITPQVLAQIILEFDPEKLDLLPPGFLASLLRGKNPSASESFPSVDPDEQPSGKPQLPPASPRPQASQPASSPTAQTVTKGEAYDLLRALASSNEKPSGD